MKLKVCNCPCSVIMIKLFIYITGEYKFLIRLFLNFLPNVEILVQIVFPVSVSASTALTYVHIDKRVITTAIVYIYNRH